MLQDSVHIRIPPPQSNKGWKQLRFAVSRKPRICWLVKDLLLPIKIIIPQCVMKRCICQIPAVYEFSVLQKKAYQLFLSCSDFDFLIRIDQNK
jgi:hypothetical protein